MKPTYKKVINPIHLPTNLPFNQTLLYILFLKVFNITGVWLGVFIVLLVLFWLVAVYNYGREKFSDVIFKGDHVANASLSDYERLIRELKE